MTILWTIWGFLTSRVGQIVVVVGAALLYLARMRHVWKQDAREEMELKDARRADKVRARVDKAARKAMADTRRMSASELDERLRDAGLLRKD